MAYGPRPIEASSLAILRDVVEREFREVSEAFDKPDVLEFTVRFADLTKKKRGMVIYADGTSFNPGSGEGIYRWTGAAWVFVG